MAVMFLATAGNAQTPEYVSDELIIKFRRPSYFQNFNQKEIQFMGIQNETDLPADMQQLFKLLNIKNAKAQFKRPVYPRETLIRSFVSQRQEL